MPVPPDTVSRLDCTGFAIFSRKSEIDGDKKSDWQVNTGLVRWRLRQ